MTATPGPANQSTVIRLDQLTNPFGPTDAVADVLGDLDYLQWQDTDSERTLRRRIGQRYGVDQRWIVLSPGIAGLYEAMVSWRASAGPVVTFPPTENQELAWALGRGARQAYMRRQQDFSLGLAPDEVVLPASATSVLMSPNDPSGTIVNVHELVRLARQSQVTVVDERHGGYTPRTAAVFTREFDNLVVFQSMEWWAGLINWPLAWAIAPPSIAEELAAHIPDRGPSREAVLAGLATLDDWVWVQDTLRRVTIEKGRLFRQLRKLNMISPPYRSWGNFLLARFERGSSDFFVPRLEERGIRVHRVDDLELPNHIRVSAVSSEATDALKRALIAIALDL